LKQWQYPNQTMARIDGLNDPTNPGIEAALDTEYIIGIGLGVPTWFVSTSGEHQGQERFLHWILKMLNTTNPPYVHSVSYGDYEDSLSKHYADRINTQFQIFGTMGRTILFSSGDDGVGCATNCSQFVANFPSSSPYVTSVGGTVWTGSGQQQIGDTISSGGFSFWYNRAPYQQQAVQHYLNTANLPAQQFFNRNGRAIPDIASFSEGVSIVYSGSWMGVGGTSCASPVVGGIISLLNDYRFHHGKPSLGFLNYWIYQTAAAHSDAFYDVTSGSNPSGCCTTGFPAQSGWDPVTGVGTPNFGSLLKYV